MAENFRKDLEFATLDEALELATEWVKLHASGAQIKTSGEFSLGQILEHLARSIDIGLGNTPVPKASWLMRGIARLMKNRFLRVGMKPGFQLPAASQDLFWPETDVDPEEALQHFAKSISDLLSTQGPIQHPYFGQMTQEEQVVLNCRHAELHMNFVIAP